MRTFSKGSTSHVSFLVEEIKSLFLAILMVRGNQ